MVIGAGSAGLTAAGFAAQIGARVALVERERIGGDCTWSGCVPSKALLVVCDTLLVAVGRAPNVAGLDLERADIVYPTQGITVDAHMRTSVPHIYAAGDVTGGPQYTHLAAWQAFYATRNALVPGSSVVRDDIIPRVTFTDPEVAHVGLTEAEARARHGHAVVVTDMALDHFDRAVCENDLRGFLKVVHRRGGAILGATMVAAHAGEAITEFALAIRHGLPLNALTDALHPYPTYTTGIMQLAADATANSVLTKPAGRLALRAARWLNDHGDLL